MFGVEFFGTGYDDLVQSKKDAIEELRYLQDDLDEIRVKEVSDWDVPGNILRAFTGTWEEDYNLYGMYLKRWYGENTEVFEDFSQGSRNTLDLIDEQITHIAGIDDAMKEVNAARAAYESGDRHGSWTLH